MLWLLHLEIIMNANYLKKEEFLIILFKKLIKNYPQLMNQIMLKLYNKNYLFI